MARAGRAVLTGTSELNRVWLAFWNEQIEEGLAALRAPGHCRTWRETLEIQTEFARTSVERTCARAAESAEVTAGVIADGLKPLQENARRTAERAPRAVA